MCCTADCGTQVYDLMSIASPMLQYKETSQGAFFDPTQLGGDVTCKLQLE
jgi:hypothetical protein